MTAKPQSRETECAAEAGETPRVTFAARDGLGFAHDVRREVATYFHTRGLSDKGNAAMVAKTVVLLALTFVPYGLILSGWFPPLAMLGLAVVMGLGVAGIGFSVGHDALHGAYSSSAAVNRLVGLSFELVGGNGYMWKITHNVIHHTYTNVDGVDEDLEVSPLLRLSPHSPLRWFHRYQHVYAFAAYSMSTLFWVFVKDYKYFLQRDLGPYRDKRHSARAVAELLAGKALYYTLMIVLPLLLLPIPWWQFAIGFLTVHLTAGLILGVVFQLAHVVEGTEYPSPNPQGYMPHEWTIHEMETTSNFAADNRWLTWYVGGLNYQVEHHLFPKVCSVHYPAIRPIVRTVAAQHGIAYHEHATFWDAVRSHYRMLRALGSDAWMHRATQPAAG